MHYLLHAMGMWHTHQREDRDSKVLYKAENTKVRIDMKRGKAIIYLPSKRR